MRAYVQQGSQEDFNFLSLDQTAHWFWERGYEVIRFDYPELGAGVLDRGLRQFSEETIVAGGVGTIREALQRAGRPLPENLDLPQCLDNWIGRRFWTSTLDEIRSLVEANAGLLPVHVKPLRHHKKFKGRVIAEFRDLIPTADIDGEMPVLVQEVVRFASEWRASVFRGRIVHVGNYAGDPLLFPDANRMQGALKAFVSPPVACAMDWGVTEAGETLLVEVNDAFALGAYGIRGSIYTAMIEARWRQLMGLADNGVGEWLSM
ncbi:ATP-grasp domain-containing protein [Planctomicrobium piriforme]|uniref:ATP-grasp domain-containing protein n=1 Tax=Planctomicrobium piriforme TaxID=1576369 RepID=A0A1I3PB32_9PLAN|nr:ATP-grasp domain-containing protein [Planctomicrobium piriforme]SFJ18540.1 protein of unknown function [Planctomicrobium piriforme]